MPRDTVPREIARDENQRTLMRMFLAVGENGGGTGGMLDGGIPTLALYPWWSSCWRYQVFLSTGSSCSSLYESMTNAVTAEKKRPDCGP